MRLDVVKMYTMGESWGLGALPLENHKWPYRVSLEILTRTPLEKQLDPSGPIASRGRSVYRSVKYVDEQKKLVRTKTESDRPIPRNSVESDHGCTSRIYFDNAGDNVTLTLYNVTLTSRKPW